MKQEIYDRIFSKGNIGSMELKNRIVMAPMGVKSDPDGGVCEREIAYYEARAKGGTGLIITGRFASTEKYEMRSHHLLVDYHHVGRLALLAEKVHVLGSKLCVQIGPGLGRMVHQDPHTPPYSASAIPSFYYPELMCRPYEKEDIHYLAWSVGNAAMLAKRADVDAVELHAYGGYLLDQFMSTLYNKRADEYGGSLENRMRFTMECVSQIQEQCGNDYPLIVKYTAYHGIPGGRELEEGIEIAKMLESAGVHAIHIDKGCYERWYDQISTVYEPKAHQIEVAAAVRKEIAIPVISHGKLDDPDTLSGVLKSHPVDFIALGHQMLSDPDYADKLKTHREEDIRPCIGCNECLHQSHKGKIQTCALNPTTLRENDYPLTPAGAAGAKSLLVVGGGAAGCVAAIVAAKRGHKVRLTERSGRLGGMLLYAGAPSFKQDMLRYADYLETQVKKLPVDLKLSHETTAEEVLNGNYDAVFIAGGAKPFTPPIKGVDQEHVMSAFDVLERKISPGKETVVIGGGLIGCETAVMIADEVKDAHVTIVEMLPEILYQADHCLNNDQKIKEMIRERNIDVLAGASITEIKKDSVSLMYEGNAVEVTCDNVVVAAGMRADTSLQTALEGKVEVTVLGDAIRARKVFTAVHEAFHAARLL